MLDPLGGLTATTYDACAARWRSRISSGRVRASRVTPRAGSSAASSRRATSRVAPRRPGPRHRRPRQRPGHGGLRPRRRRPPRAGARTGPQPHLHPGVDPGRSPGLARRRRSATRWDRDRDGLVTSRRTAGRPTSYSTTRPDGWPRCRPTGGARSSSTATPTAGWSRCGRGRDPPLGPRPGRAGRGIPPAGPDGGTTTSLGGTAAGGSSRRDAGAGTSRYPTTSPGSWSPRVDARRHVGVGLRRRRRLVHEMGPDGATDYTYDDAHQLVRRPGPAGRRLQLRRRRAAHRAVGAGGHPPLPVGRAGRLTGMDDDARTAPEVDVDAFGRLAAFDGTPLHLGPGRPGAGAGGHRRPRGRRRGRPPGRAGRARRLGRLARRRLARRGRSSGGATDPWGARPTPAARRGRRRTAGRPSASWVS